MYQKKLPQFSRLILYNEDLCHFYMLSSRSFASMKSVLLPHFHANKGNFHCPHNNWNHIALNRKKVSLEELYQKLLFLNFFSDS